MVIFFGPPGSGKSMQGQMMAARHGWRWISTGDLLRRSGDPKIAEILKSGNLISDEIVNKLFYQAIDGDNEVILDGYPRTLEQAQELFSRVGDKIDLALVLEVPVEEIKKRLAIRKRPEDELDTMLHRIEIYNKTMAPIIDFLREKGIEVLTVDGSGLVGEIHDRIEKILEDHKVTGVE